MPQDSILENLFFFANDARTLTYFLQSLTFVAEAISLPELARHKKVRSSKFFYL